MIPALLLVTPDCIITAGASSSYAGFIDGTGTPFPGVTIGSKNFTLAVFNGVTLHGVYTDTSTSRFQIGTSASVSGLSDMTIAIGDDVYTSSDFVSATFAANGVGLNYTLKNALVNGQTYIFSVT